MSYPRAATPGEQSRDPGADRRLRHQQRDLRRESSAGRARRSLRMTTTRCRRADTLELPGTRTGGRHHPIKPRITDWQAQSSESSRRIQRPTRSRSSPSADRVRRDDRPRRVLQVEATRHHPNELCCLVGDTAKARKGISLDHVARLLSEAHPSVPSAASRPDCRAARG